MICITSLQSTFIFSVIWSIGATCDKNGRDMFSDFFHELCSGKMEGHEIPSVVGKVDCPIPADGRVYDYLFEQKGRGKWTPWLDLVKDKGINPSIKQLSEIIVPTLDTARCVWYSVSLYVMKDTPHNLGMKLTL